MVVPASGPAIGWVSMFGRVPDVDVEVDVVVDVVVVRPGVRNPPVRRTPFTRWFPS
jgi:hypothetical protein